MITLKEVEQQKFKLRVCPFALRHDMHFFNLKFQKSALLFPSILLCKLLIDLGYQKKCKYIYGRDI